MGFVDLLIEMKREKEKYFKNYMKYAKRIKKIIRKKLPDAKVFVFGSVVKRTYTPLSDIDLLIVSKKMPKRISERNKLIEEVWKKIGVFSPFEIHLVNEKEFEWYKRFIDKMVRV